MNCKLFFEKRAMKDDRATEMFSIFRSSIVEVDCLAAAGCSRPVKEKCIRRLGDMSRKPSMNCCTQFPIVLEQSVDTALTIDPNEV